MVGELYSYFLNFEFPYNNTSSVYSKYMNSLKCQHGNNSKLAFRILYPRKNQGQGKAVNKSVTAIGFLPLGKSNISFLSL